jgi:sortase A
MMLSKALGAIGRFLITSGIVVLLFVAYQLWGTGIQEAAAQNDLQSDFDLLLAEVGADGSAEPDSSTSTSTSSSSTTTGPTTTTTTIPDFDTIPVQDEALAEALYREGGEPIARIVMPTIDVEKVVVEGVQVGDLRNGPGHYQATALPGHAGNTGIAGHRTTYGAPFSRIDELVPGDEFTVETVQGVHRYRVLPAGRAFDVSENPNVGFTVEPGSENLGHIIVRPQDTWVLGDFGDDRITLTACHPKYSASRRIIVAAELISGTVDAPPPPADYVEASKTELVSESVDESEPTNPDGAGSVSDTNETPERAVVAVDEVSLDEGLDGEEGALVPGIAWGLAAIAVYQAFKQLGRRWKLWPSIAIGFVPVVVFMALAFEKIDRFLPAG